MAFSYRVRSEKYCFDPERHGPGKRGHYAISRSKLDLFLECPRCFYLDQRHGIKRPDTYPLTLNVAVDELFKKEFDILRERSEPHTLMQEAGIDAVPYAHEDLEEWRDSLKRGISYHDEELNLTLRGGIDDVWQNASGELHIVDYKATAKQGEVTLDAEWQDGYKRQVEVYQWLFRKNGFPVSDTAYFVYANGDASREQFDARLEFRISIIPYVGSDEWVEDALCRAHECLMAPQTLAPGPNCAYCAYRDVAGKFLLKEFKEKKTA